jgi:hypothetical protein
MIETSFWWKLKNPERYPRSGLAQATVKAKNSLKKYVLFLFHDMLKNKRPKRLS